MRNNNQGGFTLLELVIATAVFTVLLIVAAATTISAIRFQTSAAASQDALENVRSALEVMGRDIRLAAKDKHNPQPCIATFRGNFEHTPTTLKFLNDQGKCLLFSLADGQIVRTIDGVAEPLTSEEVAITALNFDVKGENGNDKMQPRVIIQIAAKSVSEPDVIFKAQTSLTQRELDVQ